ncbi:MAG: DUF6635 family protein [Inquilinaceae bacterium]
MSSGGSSIDAATDAASASDPAPGTALAVIDDGLARRIVDDAIDCYIAERRRRIPAFVDRNFSFAQSVRLHRKAAGLDMIRAPANLALAVPHLLLRAAASGGRRVGAQGFSNWLDRRRVFFTSAVGRELEWRLFSEFLEMPYAQDDRRFDRDALSEAVFSDPRIDDAVRQTLAAIGRHADDPRFQDWLTNAMTAYAGSRVAASDIANALMAASVGALAFKQLTPGMVSLGPAIAHAVAQHMAIASFPLGAGIGSLWFGALPAGVSAALVFSVTGGLMAVAAVLTAFSGIVTDPMQRRLGLHQRRLSRLVDSLEAELKGRGDSRFVVRDHYVARVLDLLDVLKAAYAVAR